MKNKMYSAIEVKISEKLLENGYEWLAEDSDETLYAYDARPVKKTTTWMSSSDRRPLPLLYRPARGVIPIFESVRWTDAEPVRLRDIALQILTKETIGLSGLLAQMKITVETDEENPVQIAMISSDSIGLMDGYRMKLTPRDTERG